MNFDEHGVLFCRTAGWVPLDLQLELVGLGLGLGLARVREALVSLLILLASLS
jgi:hypothetical protein